MQTLDLELHHFNFFCPVTGIRILSAEEEANLDAPSVMGFWHDQFIDEPTINNPELQKAWDEFNAEHDIHEDFEWISDALEHFLESYNSWNWVVYKLTHSGMACGPVSDTVWFVMDMETVTEEELIQNKLEKETNYQLVVHQEDNSIIEIEKFLDDHQDVKQAAFFIGDFDKMRNQLMKYKVRKAGRVGAWDLGFNETDYDKVEIEEGIIVLGITSNDCRKIAKDFGLDFYYQLERKTILTVQSADNYEYSVCPFYN